MLKRVFLMIGIALPSPALGDLGLNIYGFAYHFDRSRARAAGLDNEIIGGLGLRYRVRQSEQLQWIFDAAAYRDSARNTALLAGAGALWHVSQGWRVGGALVAFKSDTYNQGKAFVAPLPVAAYEFRPVTLNFAFTPRWSEVNDVATLAVWLTWWL